MEKIVTLDNNSEQELFPSSSKSIENNKYTERRRRVEDQLEIIKINRETGIYENFTLV